MKRVIFVLACGLICAVPVIFLPRQQPHELGLGGISPRSCWEANAIEKHQMLCSEAQQYNEPSEASAPEVKAEGAALKAEALEAWAGTWASDKTKKKGAFRVFYERDGEQISGNIKITGSSVTKGGDINGSIVGNNIEFGMVKDNRGKLTYTGVISGDTMAGTWEIPVIKDSGSWEATRAQTL